MSRKRWLKRLGILSAVLLVLSGIAAGVLFYLYRQYIVENPGDHLERNDILRRISMESPVLYRDGAHKIGVFFGAEHRQYVKYDEIPKDFINAIVSSEDANFFHHHGIDPRGIARAMVANVKARRVVAGGSTISQQTAKNLYYRNDRTWTSKLEELVNTLRLEAHYSKKEILEFYVNQFHVHSNGRGLGIAARYFFNKEVKELTTLECAFLAGVVKGPSRYNPFIGATEEQRAKARARARIRTGYVLDRMQTNGYLKPEQVAELKKQELKFKEGDFRYDQNVILDYVFDVLQEERFAKLLQEHGIDNPATAGIQVLTTVDRDYQLAAEYGMRHNLSDVGAMLEGLTLEAFLGPPARLMPLERDALHPYGFYEGAVTGTYLTGKGAPGLEIDLGGVPGRVDKKGIQRVADLLKRAQGKNAWSRATDKEIRALVEQFPKGRTVYVSVASFEDDGTPRLDLEARTLLQGGLVVLDKGRIRAMVGGQDNRNFNRAAQARRQLGSTLKPLVYAAAVTLGWGALSPLDNRRQGFFFQNQWYWPRPDHEGVTPYVSMAYAASTSENLAAVSQLYHLTDLLTAEQMKDLAHRVGMAPKEGESTTDYATRMRDEYGMIPTDTSLAEGLYEDMKRDVKIELAFNGKAREATELTYLPYGNGFAAELLRTQKYNGPATEKQARNRFLRRNFVSLEEIAPKAMAAAELLLRGTSSTQAATPGGVLGFVRNALGFGPSTTVASADLPPPPAEALNEALRNFYTRKDGETVRLIYSERGDPAWSRPSLPEARWLLAAGPPPSSAAIDVPGVKPGTEPVKPPAAKDPAVGGLEFQVEAESPAPAAVPAGTGASQPAASSRPEDLILLEGVLSPGTVMELRKQLDQKLAETSTLEKYDLNRLILHKDFRIMVGLQYVIQLAGAMGVQSKQRPVLSMALGSNEITLLEAAMIYQTFLEGKAYSFGADHAETAIIQEIRDPAGKVIYQLEEKPHAVVDASVGPTVGRMLRAVVERGTAYKARQAVTVSSPDPTINRKLQKQRYFVPLFGKTGTTNDYLNVAFIGFVPAPAAAGRDLPYGQALTIASYVGYDDNRPMKRGSIRVQGSTGALPAWLDTARGVVRALDLSRLVDPEFLSPGAEVKVAWPPDMAAVAVDATTGLRAGIGVILPDAELAGGTVGYEIYGSAEGTGFREREAYLPFTPWGQNPETVPKADDTAAQAEEAAAQALETSGQGAESSAAMPGSASAEGSSGRDAPSSGAAEGAAPPADESAPAAQPPASVGGAKEVNP